jgi:hypothetical protein
MRFSIGRFRYTSSVTGGCDESVGKRKVFALLAVRSTHDDSADPPGSYCGFVVIT